MEIRNSNIIVPGVGADKEYINFGDRTILKISGICGDSLLTEVPAINYDVLK